MASESRLNREQFLASLSLVGLSPLQAECHRLADAFAKDDDESLSMAMDCKKMNAAECRQMISAWGDE